MTTAFNKGRKGRGLTKTYIYDICLDIEGEIQGSKTGENTLRTITLTLLAICCLFLGACTEHVLIGDNGILPEGQDAGQDAADDQQADTNVQPDVQADVQPEAVPDVQPDVLPDAQPPTVTVQVDPTLQNSLVYYKTKHDEMLRLTLIGDANADATITRLKVTRHGVGSNADIQTLYLLGQDYKMLTMQEATLDQTNGTAEFTDLSIAVPAKAQVMVRLVAKLDGPAAAQHGFAVEASSDVDALAPAVVSGNFPVQGPTFVLGTTMEPELLYAFEGPSAPPDAHAGDHGVTLFAFSVTALNRRMDITNWNLFLTSNDGGLVRGSAGTFCWNWFRIMDDQNTTYAAFVDLNNEFVANGAAGAYFGIQPPLPILEPGVPMHLRIVANSTATEDAPGECFGHAYGMTLKLPGYPTDVTDADYADPLDPGQISPQSDIVGNAIKLVSP